MTTLYTAETLQPVAQRAAHLGREVVSHQALTQLAELCNQAVRHQGVKIVVPPALDPLLHLALEADALLLRLARKVGVDFHHMVATRNGHEGADGLIFPKGTRYGDNVPSGAELFDGAVATNATYAEPGCWIWCDPLTVS